MKVNVSSRDLDRYVLKNEISVSYDPSKMCYILKKNGISVELEFDQDGLLILDLDRPNKISEILKIGVYEER